MGVNNYGEENKRLVLGTIKAHKTITTAEIAKVLGKPNRSVHYICRALEEQGYVHAQKLNNAHGHRLVWSIVPMEEGQTPPKRLKRNTPEDPDYWVPQPWVHPIRKRILEG